MIFYEIPAELLAPNDYYFWIETKTFKYRMVYDSDRKHSYVSNVFIKRFLRKDIKIYKFPNFIFDHKDMQNLAIKQYTNCVRDIREKKEQREKFKTEQEYLEFKKNEAIIVKMFAPQYY